MPVSDLVPCLCQRWESKAKWHCSICGGTGVVTRERREAALMSDNLRRDGMPEWVRNLVADHYERVAEDPKPYESIADTIWEAYEKGLVESEARTARLVNALLEIEVHHTRLNRAKGRPLEESHTLSVVRSAFSDVGEGDDDE